ncbi:MAG: SprT family zinc-dependent metalloprotease [Lapillicoccus sp.]
MDTRDALDLARALLDTHGLTSWSVEWDSAKTRAGICRFQTQTIGLSAPLTRLHDEPEVRDTILHEIAHALAGPQAKHGPRWRQVARSIGCTGRRCVSDEAARIAGSWVGVCPDGHGVTRHRAPARVMTCSECSPCFDLRHLFTWSHHGDPAHLHPNYVAELAALRAGAVPVTALPVGAQVRIVIPGRYAGQLGTVVRRGRTRFHVRCAEVTIDVPFAGVERVVVGLPTGFSDDADDLDELNGFKEFDGFHGRDGEGGEDDACARLSALYPHQ